MNKSKDGTSRRDVLKLAGVSVPVAVAAVTAAAPQEAEAAEAPGAAGLRKTDHVKKYLETARF